MFSGGRAISENLQLDRLLRPTKPADSSVDLKTLPGIDVAEMDWSKLTKGIDPKLDPLAKLIPHDQHALFFSTFESLTRVMDEAEDAGTPVLRLVQSRSEDARVKERYQTQLCLKVSAVSRLLGPKIIRSVAFTGSDPYLPTGTGVAILFETKSTLLLQAFLQSKHTAAMKTHPHCRRVKGTVGNVSYTGVVSPGRAVCSYVAVIGQAVVVTNSTAQLKRLAETAAGKVPALSSLPEYRFFRHRYRRGDKAESALLIVTDATIRRWCGPKWRIANSRRTRAAAILAHLQAAHLADLVAGKVKSREIETGFDVSEMGIVKLEPQGVTSSRYGSLEFMTPISELGLTHVTPDEAAAYRRWRDNYQRNWRQFFDPIAVRIGVRDNRLTADVTVMPLIQQSDYNSYLRYTLGAKIKPRSGDRHPGTLLNWTMAINTKLIFDSIEGMFPFRLANWIGDSVSVYADADPFWLELARAKNKQDFLGNNLHRLPVALRVEVKDGVKLAAFLAVLKVLVNDAAPDLTKWEVRKHNGKSYVHIAVNEKAAKNRHLEPFHRIKLCYYATPTHFTVTFREDLLKRAIDRDVARAKRKAGKPVAGQENLKPWLGSSMALQLDAKALALLEPLFGDDHRKMMQAQAWGNLPVLNEWKRLYPDKNPVRLHATHWQMKLLCPGGGKYVWNDKFQTMESTVYGHPGEPKPGPKFPAALRSVKSLNLGVTFEHQGLRARVEIERSKK